MSTRSVDSRGSVSGFVVCLVSALVLLAGFVNSFGAHVGRYVELSGIAAAAARAAGQSVVGIREGNPRLDFESARRSARAILVAAGVRGSVTVQESQVTVTVDADTPLTLGPVGFPRFWHVHVVRHADTVEGD